NHGAAGNPAAMATRTTPGSATTPRTTGTVNANALAKSLPTQNANRLAPGAANRLTPGANRPVTAALGQGRTALRSPAQHRQFELAHRVALQAQFSRLPQHVFPGERGFTGVPPAGETRFVASETVVHVGANVSRESVDNVARRLGLSTVGPQTSTLTGGTLYRFRTDDGRQASEVVRALEAESIGIAQPNYVYRTTQDNVEDTNLAGRSKPGDPGQYVLDKLRLADVHRVATGSNVKIAVIDSQIDVSHPDLAGAVVEQFDAVGAAEKPHPTATGMPGATSAHRKLMGIAPGVKILAIHAFSTDSAESPQATTQHILAGMDWAISKGARIINMSFAGPYDPMLQMAM